MGSITASKFIRLLLCIPFFLGIFYFYYSAKSFRLQQKRQAINVFAGKKLPVLPLIDTAGNSVDLSGSLNETTIVDFWYRNCPDCIGEMKQFDTLLKRQKKINIISISVDKPEDWREAVEGRKDKYLFFKQRESNWRHLLLNTAGQPLNGFEYVARHLQVTGYPSYFIIDKSGTVTDVPVSAVEYLKSGRKGIGSFGDFIKSGKTWTNSYTYLLLLGTIFLCWRMLWKKR